MIDPHKPKYFPLYWRMAYQAQYESVATREQVGSVVVTTSGMLSIGWNGMPAGMPNACETYQHVPGEGRHRLKTNRAVIHAEQNALDKMLVQGIPTKNALLFVTLSPCFECAKKLVGLGLKAIHYDRLHDCTEGLDLLKDVGVSVVSRDENHTGQSLMLQ
ncbi:deaminase [Larsenimonas suaedae]|uniref:Deaminase n=1 Tax=Larsenimonas suaedae TaxID=1851019 RepID=A0ABU1GZ94_9GAMM|nr:deaminase [Larsenimonas suaedae]MCM2973770.1 deaminase [Larsenimonas suaedae]MDR5897294.1 deaminase [Larsenimonas suaedae]